MKELLTVVTRKGQVTVPAEVRQALNLRQGDKVAFVLPESPAGEVTLRRVGSVVEQTFGALASPLTALSVAEERRAFEEGVAKEVVDLPPCLSPLQHSQHLLRGLLQCRPGRAPRGNRVLQLRHRLQ